MSAQSFPYTQGRITHQRRGANVVSATGGDYHYYAGKNQLERVSLGMDVVKEAQRNRSAKGTFVYDLDGNLIEDKSKEMTILYDYRGMPREMTRAVVSAEGVVDSVRLTMFYDGSGNRITKRYERKGVSDASWQLQLATHYTGLGSEIRERDSSAKVVVNLPQGLGRYTVSDAQRSGSESPGFEWYLKNHLGSTMLVFGTGSGSGGVKAAYDYRAFGERVSLVVSSDKVTEEFTGKELDEESGLNYFGARYYDAELGVWVSVDPKRQFPSPYLYVGNGFNPVNGVDVDGGQFSKLAMWLINQAGKGLAKKTSTDRSNFKNFALEANRMHYNDLNARAEDLLGPSSDAMINTVLALEEDYLQMKAKIESRVSDNAQIGEGIFMSLWGVANGSQNFNPDNMMFDNGLVILPSDADLVFDYEPNGNVEYGDPIITGD